MLECNYLFTKKTTKPLRILALLLPVICIILLLTQTVFAKNTYLINDNGRVVLHTTYASDPAAVLDEVGLQLGEDDIFTTQPGLGISEITIQRKQLVSVYHGGNLLQVVSYGESVQSLLNRLSLILTAEDVVSVPLDSQTFDGLKITISRAVQVEETYTTRIPFETIYRDDPTLPEGEQRLITEGVDGQMLCTANVVYAAGKELSRDILSEEVLVEPVHMVIAVGTGENVKPDMNYVPDNLIRPQFTGKPIIGNGYIITPEGERLTYTYYDEFVATAYHNSDPGCTEFTAIETYCRVGAIAVDPTVIPYGTRMYIVTNDGKYIYGIATAEDCGKSIKGNRVDLYFDSVAECNKFGIRDCKVYFLG